MATLIKHQQDDVGDHAGMHCGGKKISLGLTPDERCCPTAVSTQFPVPKQIDQGYLTHSPCLANYKSLVSDRHEAGPVQRPSGPGVDDTRTIGIAGHGLSGPPTGRNRHSLGCRASWCHCSGCLTGNGAREMASSVALMSWKAV